MVSTKVGKRQEFNDKGKFVINDEDESSICFDEDDDIRTFQQTLKVLGSENSPLLKVDKRNKTATARWKPA